MRVKCLAQARGTPNVSMLAEQSLICHVARSLLEILLQCERLARVGYNHFISNKSKWNNCFSKFSNRVLPPIFISAI